jgi:hypothetical protein
VILAELVREVDARIPAPLVQPVEERALAVEKLQLRRGTLGQRALRQEQVPAVEEQQRGDRQRACGALWQQTEEQQRNQRRDERGVGALLPGDPSADGPDDAERAEPGGRTQERRAPCALFAPGLETRQTQGRE